MRIACVGGGPGGLFFSLLLKRLRPEWEIVLFERNRADDAFGFGVVFSDATLRAIDEADPILSTALAEHGVHWDEIEVWAKGQRETFGGNGMAAIHRRRLLTILEDAAVDAGVELRFEQYVPTLEELGEFDLIVAADGANSALREQLADHLGHHVETASAKFIWFGTDHMFDGLTFIHAQNDDGNFAAHAYPISEDVSTFIIETDEDTWRRAGLDEFDVTSPHGPSDEKSRAYMAQLFADSIPGGRILVNSSRWANFRTRRTDRWHHGNVVFLGDAMHTAHFSVGSGTKMAMEDAIVLAREVSTGGDLEASLTRYEEQRRPAVAHIQNAAIPSLAWWERFGEYYRAFEPWQFAFHFFSRSINIDKIRRRDPRFVAHVEQSWVDAHGAPAIETRLEVAGVTVPGRVLNRDGERIVHRGSGTSVNVGDIVLVDAADPAVAPPGGAVLVAGAGLGARTARAERLRLDDGRTVLIEVDDVDPVVVAETLVLSGRADAVVVRGG